MNNILGHTKMNSVMTDCRKYSKNKYYMNHNFKNGHLLLIIIYTMALIFESHGTTLGTDDDENCSVALTCTKCTIKAQCAWSLEHQTCVDSTQFNLPNLTIYKENKCPRFSVVTKYKYSNEMNHLEYIIKVSNDHVNFMKYLKESKFFCNSTTIDVHKKTIKNDKITCSANILTSNFELHRVQSFTAFIYIKFNGTLLRLDNVADHYVTFYKHECAEDKKDENCAACTWNEYGFAHYVRLCSSGNSCEGRNELYLFHDDVGKSWNSITRKVKDQCAEINVTAVDPLSGTMAGGTTIKITVKNHFIFEENRKVMVTVAGMLCADPRTSGPETITCVTTPPAKDTYEAPSGPVLIKYTSHEHELIIESSQKFHYYVDVSGGAFRPVLMFPTHSSALETMSNKISCSDSMACTKCTLTPECVWSLKQQECGHKNQFNSSSLISSTISECPQFSIVTSYNYNDFKNRILVKNELKIMNDLIGFTNYLLGTKMYYVHQNTFEKEVRIYDNTLIWVTLQKEKSIFDVEMPTVTYFTFFKFDGIMLRFDNVADHYFTFYKHEECATNETKKYQSCATCGWNKNGNSNYLKWCSSENTCEVNRNLYMKNNATHQLNENVAYVTNDCAEINVTAVSPLAGPQTGGTTVTIIVKNHRIFAENRTLKVTVAGTACTNLKTSGLETITCTTTSHPIGSLSGPIIVEYSSNESVLKIESSQIFQFCLNPALDEDQQLGSVVSGGTSVTVRGSHFVVSSARLYVNLAVMMTVAHITKCTVI